MSPEEVLAVIKETKELKERQVRHHVDPHICPCITASL